MEILVVSLLIIFLCCVCCPELFILFMPNIKGIGCLGSVIIGLILVGLFGWWGLLLYIIICILKND